MMYWPRKSAMLKGSNNKIICLIAQLLILVAGAVYLGPQILWFAVPLSALP